MQRGDWAKAQTDRVQGPTYARKAKKARDAKRRAKFPAWRFHVPAWRRMLWVSAKADAFHYKLEKDQTQ